MIVLNPAAKKEVVPLDRSTFPGTVLGKYVIERSRNLEDFIHIRESLFAAYECGAGVKFNAKNLDQAMTWSTTPQGDIFWSPLHSRLEKWHD